MPRNAKTRRLVFTALMAALLAVSAPFTIPVGPVPVTLALFWVFFLSLLLPVPDAMAAVGVYLALGLLGLPVFSGFRGGPQVLFGPTGGYLIGYFFIALTVSIAAGRTRRPALRAVACVAGLAGCYLFGTLWFMVFAGVSVAEALALCVAPFVLPDMAKIALALVLAQAVEARLHIERPVS